MADTSRTLVIESAPDELLSLIGLGALMTAVAVSLALLPGVPIFFRIVGGYFGVAFFGLATGEHVRRWLSARGVSITISPEGFCDTRIAAEIIPWSAITRISTVQIPVPGPKSMVLVIKPGIETRLGFTWFTRFMRCANRALGINSLFVSALGMKIDYDTLVQTCEDYWRQATSINS